MVAGKFRERCSTSQITGEMQIRSTTKLGVRAHTCDSRLGWLRQADHEFKAGLGYVINSRLT